MPDNHIHKIKTITHFHRLRGLTKPEHPLISVINYADIIHAAGDDMISWVLDFYFVSIKRNINGKIKYGQEEYDFDEGIMFFIAPNQVFKIAAELNQVTERSGWMLLIHPDFLWNTPLAKTISQYNYFGYSVNEALFLSRKEKRVLNNVIQNIKQEYHSNIDKFSQSIIISQVETLLHYSDRFYQRQFITRKIANHQILDRLENLLSDYFCNNDLLSKGLPTVQYTADTLNISQGYLSSLLAVFNRAKYTAAYSRQADSKGKRKIINHLFISK